LHPPITVNAFDDPQVAVGQYFAVWRHDGSVLKALGLPAGAHIPEGDLPGASDAVRFAQRGEFREASLHGPMDTRILVGKSTRREQEQLTAFAWQLAGASALVLAVGLAGGWLVSARILQPLAEISATAATISETNLAQRINEAAVDRELAELAGVLNAAFGRLEAAFARQARFTADASHELRTPLAIIRSHAELALARPREPGAYREALDACLHATGRMTALVDALLTLARADAGKLDIIREPVELHRVIQETAAMVRPLAEAKGLRMELNLPPALVPGDAGRLAQVVTNLLSNAVQYNKPGGKVRVSIETADGWVHLSVEDTGPGIAEADRPHLFERFYRVDKARARASGGNGLGLAICKGIVEAHRGSIGFTTEWGRGTTFHVRLPAAGTATP
jgi:heavy metal sensor kinase